MALGMAFCCFFSDQLQFGLLRFHLRSVDEQKDRLLLKRISVQQSLPKGKKCLKTAQDMVLQVLHARSRLVLMFARPPDADPRLMILCIPID